MLKRTLTIVLSVMMVILLAACGANVKTPSSSDANTPTPRVTEAPKPAEETKPSGEISMWMGSWWEEKIPEIVEWFERDNPGITLTIEALPINGYFDNAVTAILAGNPPDVIDIDATQVSSFAAQGLLLPLDDVKAKLVIEDIAPGVFSICHYDSKAYAIPSRSSSEVWYYNKKLFDEAGVPYPTDDWNYEDMLEIAKKLTKPEKQQYGVGIAAALSDPLNVMSSFAPMLWAFGGDFMNEDYTKCTLDTPESIKGIAFWTELYTKHKVCPEGTVNYTTSKDIIPMFMNNQVAMFASGENGVSALEQDPNVEWGIVLPPNGVSRAGGWAFIVPVTADNVDAAKQLILWWQDPEIMQYISVRMPPNRNAFNVAPWNAPHYEYFKQSSMLARTLPTFGKWSEAQNIVITELQNILEGRKTPEQGAKDMTRQIDALIQQ